MASAFIERMKALRAARKAAKQRLEEARRRVDYYSRAPQRFVEKIDRAIGRPPGGIARRSPLDPSNQPWQVRGGRPDAPPSTGRRIRPGAALGAPGGSRLAPAGRGPPARHPGAGRARVDEATRGSPR